MDHTSNNSGDCPVSFPTLNLRTGDNYVIYWEDTDADTCNTGSMESMDPSKVEPSTLMQENIAAELHQSSNPTQLSASTPPCAPYQASGNPQISTTQRANRRQSSSGKKGLQRNKVGKKTTAIQSLENGKVRIKVGSTWQEVPSHLATELQPYLSPSQDLAPQQTQTGLIFEQLLNDAKGYAGKDPFQCDVGTLRKMATLFRKLLFLSPEDLQGKEKIKYLWSRAPPGWPSNIPHVDPNNSRRPDVPKPSKGQLVTMVQYMLEQYKEKHVQLQEQCMVDTVVKQEEFHTTSQPTDQHQVGRMVQQSSYSVKGAIDWICACCPESRPFLVPLYDKYWTQEDQITRQHAAAVELLKHMQDEIRKLLCTVVDAGSPIHIESMRENVKKYEDDFRKKLLELYPGPPPAGQEMSGQPQNLSTQIEVDGMELEAQQQEAQEYTFPESIVDPQLAQLSLGFNQGLALADHDYFYKDPFQKVQEQPPPAKMDVRPDHQDITSLTGNPYAVSQEYFNESLIQIAPFEGPCNPGMMSSGDNIDFSSVDVDRFLNMDYLNSLGTTLANYEQPPLQTNEDMIPAVVNEFPGDSMDES